MRAPRAKCVCAAGACHATAPIAKQQHSNACHRMRGRHMGTRPKAASGDAPDCVRCWARCARRASRSAADATGGATKTTCCAKVVARHLQALVVHPVVADSVCGGQAKEVVALLLVEAIELGIVALDREGERDDVRRHGGALAAQLLQTHHRVDELLRLRILGARRPA